MGSHQFPPPKSHLVPSLFSRTASLVLEKLVGFYRRSCWLFGAQPSVSLQTKRLDLLMIPWRWQHGSFQEELPFRFRVIFNFHDGRKGNLPTKWAPSPVISYEQGYISTYRCEKKAVIHFQPAICRGPHNFIHDPNSLAANHTREPGDVSTTITTTAVVLTSEGCRESVDQILLFDPGSGRYSFHRCLCELFLFRAGDFEKDFVKGMLYSGCLGK